MKELLLSNDPVLLSYVEALLRGEGIEPVVFDRHISLVEGSIGVFPRRLIVEGDVLHKARRLLIEAGLGQWVAGDDKR